MFQVEVSWKSVNGVCRKKQTWKKNHLFVNRTLLLFVHIAAFEKPDDNFPHKPPKQVINPSLEERNSVSENPLYFYRE
jgi:hypothetical protein